MTYRSLQRYFFEIYALTTGLLAKSKRLSLYQRLALLAICSGFLSFSLILIVLLSSDSQPIQKSDLLPIQNFLSYPSPNQDDRPNYAIIDTVIITVEHEESIMQYIQRLRVVKNRYSAHYAITPEGKIFAQVPEDRRAWHIRNGRTPDKRVYANDYAISISLLDIGPIFGDLKRLQIVALKALLQQIVRKYKIRYILTRSQAELSPRTDFYDYNFPFKKLPEFKQYFLHNNLNE